MEPDRVAQFTDLSFQYIAVVPVDGFYPPIAQAATQSVIPIRTVCSI